MNKKIYTLALVLWPILNIYSYKQGGVLGFGDILFLFLIGYRIAIVRLFKNSKVLISYIVFIGILTGVSLVDIIFLLFAESGSLDSLMSIFRCLFYSVAIIVCIQMIDLNFGMSLIKKVSILNGMIIILQQLLYSLFGIVTYGVLSFIPLNNGATYEIMFDELKIASERFYFRASGLFPEPSYAAQFIIIAIIFFLFEGKQQEYNTKNNYRWAVFLSVSCVVTTSSIGMVFVVLLWGFWFVSEYATKRKNVNSVITFLALIAISIPIVIYLESSLHLFKILQQKLSIYTFLDSDSSFSYRVTRGFKIWYNLDFRGLMFGVGMGNIDEYMANHHVLNEFIKSDYMNSMSYVLCSAGLMGGMSFLAFIYKMLSCKGVMRAMGLYAMFLCLCASTLNSPTWCVMIGLSVAYGIKKKEEGIYGEYA